MKKDTYHEPIVMQDAGAIIRIYRPILDDKEKARRMKLIHDAAANMFKPVRKEG
jgi:hypothetical protein